MIKISGEDVMRALTAVVLVVVIVMVGIMVLAQTQAGIEECMAYAEAHNTTCNVENGSPIVVLSRLLGQEPKCFSCEGMYNGTAYNYTKTVV